MAQVPNYYYNSPYIRDAAQSLASALAPPDPEKTMARQKMQFEFAQEQEKARLDEQTRAEQDIGRDFGAQLARLQPIMGPDGVTVDKEATFNRARELYAGMIENRIDPKVAETIAGPFGPGFAAKSQLAEITGDNRLNYLSQAIAGQRGLAELNQGQQNVRYFSGLQHKLTIEQMRETAAFKLNFQRAKMSLGAGGKPTLISDSQLEMITLLVMQMEEQTEHPLYDPDRNRMIAESIEEYKRTGNPEASVISVWDNTMGKNERPTLTPGPWQQMWGIDPYGGHGLPNFGNLRPVGSENLGGAAIGGGAPPPVEIPPGAIMPTPKPEPTQTRRPPRVPKDPNRRKKLEEIFGK